jgi:hypothetical protein
METRSFKKFEKESDTFFMNHKKRFDSIEATVNMVSKNIEEPGNSDLRTRNFNIFFLNHTCQRDRFELKFFKCYKKFYERWVQRYKTARCKQSILMLKRLAQVQKNFCSRRFFYENADLSTMILQEPL